MSKGVGKGSRDLVLKFWDTLLISGTVWARNFKYGTQIKHWGTNDKNEKLGQRGRKGVITCFWNVGTTFISRERFVLEYSDLGCRLTTRVTNEQNAKLGQRGREGVTWPNFSVVTQTEASVDFPLYSRPLEKLIWSHNFGYNLVSIS